MAKNINQSDSLIDEKIGQQEKTFFESLVLFFIALKPHAKRVRAFRKQLLLFNGTILVLSIVILFFLIKPYFQSTIFVLPDFGNKGSSSMFSSLSGLASLAGVSVGDNPPTLIYENLLKSEAVMSEVIYKQYKTKEYDHPVNLIQYFDLKPDESLPDSLQDRKMFLKMFKMLAKSRMETDFDRQTSILSIMIEMPESQLSADVANALVLSLDKYVRTQRRSFAIEQRKYLELRVRQVKDTLTYCEEQLTIFREMKRQILQSPKLQLDQARLMRNVEIQQTIYGELIKQLELVKLQEIKDTPVVNVREYAKEPILKTGPPRVLIIIDILFLSFVLSSLWFLLKEKFSNGWMRIRKA
jgi:capsule polysaccharide export protein KpsE/RkpR